MLGGTYLEKPDQSHRSKKLKEAFTLATDRVVKSMSKECVYLGFPEVYRDRTDVLEEFRKEFVSKLKDSMYKEFNEISSEVDIFAKLALLDQFLKSDNDEDIIDNQKPHVKESNDVPIFQLRKRFKVLTDSGNDENISLENAEPLSIVGNAAFMKYKILQTTASHLSKMNNQLSQLETSNRELAAKLSILYKKYNETISDTNQLISGIVPDPIYEKE